jgi:elongation factor Ts
MSTIKAELVKALRDRTSVSMMECKRALQETNGDIDAAIDLLRKSGEATAVKKQARVAAEGLVVISQDKSLNHAAVLEVNCETDFVAKNNKLLEFATEVASLILVTKILDINTLSNQKFANGHTVEESRLTLVTQLGENIVLRRAEILVASGEQVLGVYKHGTPPKIASIICLQGGDVNLARDIAMHAAAMRPEYLSQKDIPQDRYKKEQEIFMEQTRLNNSDKPEDILQKIVAGRINKFFKEITLVDQIFVKDPELTIDKLLAKHKAKIIKMSRFEVGEGIEKRAN